MHLVRRLSRRQWEAVGAVALAAATGLSAVGVNTVFPVPTPTPIPSPSPSPTPSPSPRPSPSPSPSPSATPELAAVCPWSGLPLPTGELITEKAFAVVVENNPIGRPTHNLTRSDMVIEATVEGDVTRFAVVFHCQETVGLTGPVRSGRYFMIDLWQDLHVLPVFFGSSYQAIERYQAAGMPYVNGIRGGWPWFRRAGTAPAPHNLYMDVEAMRDAVGSFPPLDLRLEEVDPVPRPHFSFDPDGVLPNGRTVTSVEIRTNSYWRFGWTWDAALNAWRRLEAGAAQTDAATNEPITATSVIVQIVVEEVIYGDPDPAGNPRRQHRLIGTGTGTLYLGGQAYAVRWSRPGVDDGTTWTYADTGLPVVLPPGRIWWEIEPTFGVVTER